MPTVVTFSLGDAGTTSSKEVLSRSMDMSQLQGKQADKLRELMAEFQDVFSNRPGKMDWTEHHTEIQRRHPTRSKLYRMSHSQKGIVEEEVLRVLELGVIREESDFIFPIIIQSNRDILNSTGIAK